MSGSSFVVAVNALALKRLLLPGSTLEDPGQELGPGRPATEPSEGIIR